MTRFSQYLRGPTFAAAFSIPVPATAGAWGLEGVAATANVPRGARGVAAIASGAAAPIAPTFSGAPPSAYGRKQMPATSSTRMLNPRFLH
jgi:hypothetical protein